MGFADLKNDFVFRRIFARRPDLVRAMLNEGRGSLTRQRAEPASEAARFLGGFRHVRRRRCAMGRQGDTNA